MDGRIPKAARLIANHILTHYQPASSKPLFVALQGPQGIGKSSRTSLLPELLAPHRIHVRTISIDDFYLPHASLCDPARSPLLRERGLPGTHDVPLALRVLRALKRINEDKAEVAIPAYDKSLHSGKGDRLPTSAWPVVHPPLHVILLEGWCVGFCPISEPELIRRNKLPIPGLESRNIKYPNDELLVVNNLLRDYLDLWDLFDVFIQLAPPPDSPYRPIYEWRLQAERAMKVHKGGQGMSDSEVFTFIDRYLPAYVLFSDGIVHGAYGKEPRWKGKLLRIFIEANEDREVIGEERDVTSDESRGRARL